MKKKPFVLWLVWQNQETRQRYHIGNLTHIDGEYEFSYERSGKRSTLNEAMENAYITLSTTRFFVYKRNGVVFKFGFCHN